ncbi:MAG: hypothetical protein IH795_13395, partial [Bacteroidetes bacterium]|nr:hypothetical protein [Bacteroidota bacterium]
LNIRGIVVLVPIIIFIIWIGVYPSTFLNVSEKTSDKIIEQVLELPKAELK